jgi:hypothetical protein
LVKKCPAVCCASRIKPPKIARKAIFYPANCQSSPFIVGFVSFSIEKRHKTLQAQQAAYFSKTTLTTATCYIGKNGQAPFEVITRVKQFAVAYREVEEGNGRRRGKKRIYGKKEV